MAEFLGPDISTNPKDPKPKEWQTQDALEEYQRRVAAGEIVDVYPPTTLPRAQIFRQMN